MGHKLRVLFLHMRESPGLSLYSSLLYCLNFTKSINTKVGDLIYNCIASLPTMIQHFGLIIQEIRKKLDLEIYRLSGTQSFNNIFKFSKNAGCYHWCLQCDQLRPDWRQNMSERTSKHFFNAIQCSMDTQIPYNQEWRRLKKNMNNELRTLN